MPRSYTAISDREFVSSVTYPRYEPSKLYQNVMRYEPNNYGLFDTIGGAKEIVADWWNANGPLLIANGIEPNCQKEVEIEGVIISTKECVWHVLKGGGFVHSEKEAKGQDRSEYTIHIGERGRGRFGGFRLAMDY